MTTDKQKLGVLSRSMQFERSEVNEPERTVALSFSSEQPVSRWFGNEILDHNPKSVRMGRINGSAPLLVNHNHDDVVGVVESATIEGDRKGRAVVRFGNSQRAQEIFDDVKAGIRKLVSVGYRIHKMVSERIEADVETLRAMDWEPLEISIVSVPADTSVGVGRDVEAVETIFERKNMADNVAAPAAPDIEVVRESVRKDVLTQERNRCNDLRKMADGVAQIITNSRELCERAIETGESADAFNRTLLANMPKQRHVESGSSAEIGMSQRDISGYSIIRAINSMVGAVHGKKFDGLERELSDEVAKKHNRASSGLGFFIPHDVMAGGNQRTMFATGSFASAGALVGSGQQGQSMIDLYRNKMNVVAMGARVLSGLQGTLSIPRQTGGATVAWLSESATITASDQTVGQLTLTPHRLAAATGFSSQLLSQSSIDIENFVRGDLMSVLAVEKDRACLLGLGSAGEPLGIYNTPNIGTTVDITATASITYAEAVQFETNVAAGNADLGSLGYITSVYIRGTARVTPKFASTGTPLWENDMLGSYPARATNQLTATPSVIFGNWSDLIIGDWVSPEIIVDPYSLSMANQVRVVVHQLTDVGIRHPKSFCFGVV